MRILLDASLPASLREHGTRLVTFVADPALTATSSDEELLEEIAERGFEAVALLGREALARLSMLEAARDLGTCVVVTNSEEPVQASQHLADRIEDVAEQVGPGRVILVLAREVRAWSIDDFLREGVQSARPSREREQRRDVESQETV